jgi:hypothetical protein
MKLFFKDLVTDELIPVVCESTDTLENLKYQFMAYQSLSLCPSDIHIEVLHESNQEIHSDLDLPPIMGTIEELGIKDDDIILFMYSIGA